MAERPYDRELRARGVRLAYRVDEPVPHCWMCPRTAGPLAREHIFPKWLLAFLDAEDELISPTHHDMTMRVVTTRGPMPATAFVAGEICAACNSGWMSALEAQMAPIFTRPRTEPLSVRDQLIMARWLVKTAAVLNASQNYRLLIPKAARHGIATGIPNGFRVYLAGYTEADGSLNFAQGASPMGVAPTDRIDEWQELAERTYGCTLWLGGPLGIVIYSEPHGWARPIDEYPRLWPRRKGIIKWDRLPVVETLVDPLMLTGSPLR